MIVDWVYSTPSGGFNLVNGVTNSSSMSYFSQADQYNNVYTYFMSTIKYTLGSATNFTVTRQSNGTITLGNNLDFGVYFDDGIINVTDQNSFTAWNFSYNNGVNLYIIPNNRPDLLAKLRNH